MPTCSLVGFKAFDAVSQITEGLLKHPGAISVPLNLGSSSDEKPLPPGWNKVLHFRASRSVFILITGQRSEDWKTLLLPRGDQTNVVDSTEGMNFRNDCVRAIFEKKFVCQLSLT